MRIKDQLKLEAIIQAAIQLVNEIGFVSSSVSKIAKRANVSPATLYVYFKNKEDLLTSTYIAIKEKMSLALLENFDDSKPFRDIILNLWKNGFEFVKTNRALYQYAEQFSNSPYYHLVDHKEIEKHFERLIKVLQRGIEQKVIKDVSFEILVAFMFYPIMILSNSRISKTVEMNDSTIESAFQLAWDAIKL